MLSRDSSVPEFPVQLVLQRFIPLVASVKIVLKPVGSAGHHK